MQSCFTFPKYNKSKKTNLPKIKSGSTLPNIISVSPKGWLQSHAESKTQAAAAT